MNFPETMSMDVTVENCGKSSRPVRSRRFTRRSFIAGQRPPKRLFTPEIKRYLKDWLVRRRENPYPNRDEKKILAQETGLTYIQICNWFANWRRKLKNVHEDRNQQTWGHLIRTYNDQAQGNVEQFSICSDDSIWSEPEPSNQGSDYTPDSAEVSPHHITDTKEIMISHDGKVELMNNNSYDDNSNEEKAHEVKDVNNPLLLSKWLESAARFQPRENIYSYWGEDRRRRPLPGWQRSVLTATSRHDRDEVEAAVALTALATAAGHIIAP